MTNLHDKISPITTSRLVFFADDKKPTVEGEKKEEMLESERAKAMKMPHGKEIIDLYGKGRISGKVVNIFSKQAENTNVTDKKGFDDLYKALGKGRFPKKSEGAVMFIDALKGTSSEKKHARKILKRLASDTALPLESDDIDRIRDELAAKRAEDQSDNTAKEIQSVAATTTEQGDVGSRIREIANVNEDAWNIDAPSQEFLRELDEKEMVVVGLIQDGNKMHKKIQDLKGKLKKEESAKVPKIQAINRLKNLIAQTEKELNELDKDVDEKREALHEDREKFRDFLRRSLCRYRAVKNLAKESGIGIEDARNLAMLFFKQKAAGNQTLTIEGIETNPDTGKAERKTIPVSIKRVYFEMGKDDMEPQSPGELMIDYEIQGAQHETVQASYKNFLAMVNAFEAYEVIDSTEEFNQKYAHEIGYSDVTKLEGQKFSAEILEDAGTKTHRKEGFTVTSVTQTNHGWKIEVDQPVLRKSRHELPMSMDSSGYFDRTKQTFALGEFGAFLRQRGYQRVIASGQVQDTIHKMSDAQIGESQAMLEGTPESLKKRFEGMSARNNKSFEIPEAGQEKQIMFKDTDGSKRFGILRREVDQNGEDYYIITYNAGGSNGNKHWGMPEMNDRWSKADPNSHMNWKLNRDEERTDPNGDKYQARKKRRVSGRHFMEDVNKGNIQEMPDMPEIRSDDLDEQEELMPRHGSEDLGLEGAPQEGPSEEDKGEMDTREIYEEALPYNDVYKVGGMSKPEENFLLKMWNETRFFSVNDFWEMGKSMWEYYDNRFQRRQKAKYSSVGQELPFWSPEMRRINQAAENEQVNQFKESFDQKGIYEIQDRLSQTGNRDEMKAALIVLNEKGQMRWDDIKFWKNLNRVLFDKGKAIPIPANGDPATRISDTDERTGLAFMQEAIDSLWGEGTYASWYNQNKSAFSSNLKSFYEEGKELEGVQGGHERRLSELLNIHKNGGYVDPHEYEGLIQHSIEAGKSDMQSKIYFMIEGIAYENAQGRTILSFDRMAHINSDQLLRFPILEYLCGRVPREEGGQRHRFTIDDYKRWVKWFDEGNPSNCTPGPAVDKFMWKYVISSDETQNRINKDLRNGENLDHDDMFAYLPPATEQVVTDSCKATTGSKKFLTIEGYANVGPGFSQYMRSLAENKQRPKLAEAIKSYVRFESIMTNKFEKARSQANDKYQRMDDYTLNSSTIVSVTPPKAYFQQMNKAVRAIAAEYNDPDLNRLVDIMYNTEVGDVNDPEENRRQNTVNNAFYEFGRVFHRVIQRDAGRKMEAVISGANFEGLVYLSSLQKDERKNEMAKQAAQARQNTDYSNDLAL